MNELLTNIVGCAATAAGISIMLPQVIKSWRTKRVEDVSLGTSGLYVTSCILWFIYGILIGAAPMILANGVGLVIGIIQTTLKLVYDRKSV